MIKCLCTLSKNGEGIRVAKDVDGVTTHYLYEYDKVVLEVDGIPKARSVYGTNLISRTVDGQTLYYLYNGHSDVVGLLDESGNLVGSYYYDAFGNIVEETGDINNPIRYAGYQYDEETGLYYLMARHYDPVTARFLSEDTYRGQIDDPLSLNLYTYCHNEPMMYVDPDGHNRVTDAIKNGLSTTKDILHYSYEGWKYAFENPSEVAGIIKENVVEPASKYVVTRAEGAAISTVNTIKGIVQTGNEVIGKPVIYSFQSTGNMLGNAIGIINDDTYRQIDKEINRKIDTWSNEMKALPGNIVTGLGNDINTVFNKQNAYNYFLNPNASLEDVTQYTQSTLNLGLTAYGGVKGVSRVKAGVTNGITRMKTPQPVFAAEQNASIGIKSGINQIEPYTGVRRASEYLKSQGVPRDVRKTVLESFDRRTIYMDAAGENTFGIRFHDFGSKAQPKGRYLYETFQGLSTREGAAIKHSWNDMNGISQWQVKAGTPIIKGKAAPQVENGIYYGGGIEQWWIKDLNNLLVR